VPRHGILHQLNDTERQLQHVGSTRLRDTDADTLQEAGELHPRARAQTRHREEKDTAPARARGYRRAQGNELEKTWEPVQAKSPAGTMILTQGQQAAVKVTCRPARP